MPLIRDIRAEDKSGWLPLWRGYLDFYNAVFDAAQAEITFQRLLDPREPVFAFVAENEDALVGVVQCVRHRSNWTEADYCYLQDLFVADEARGQGVGRALIEAVYARADAEGLARVYWLTHETNAEARLLYDRIAQRSGFIQYRR